MTVEMAYPDGTSGYICPTEVMFALYRYIAAHPNLKTLNNVNLMNGVIESKDFEGALNELRSIKCADDCTAIKNLIAGFEEAQAMGEEYVVMV